MGASAAAAIIIREKHIVAAFRQAGATSAALAVTTAALGVNEGVALARLRDHAVIRQAGEGRVYLDEPSWEALQRFRRRFAIIALVFAVFALLIMLVRRP